MSDVFKYEFRRNANLLSVVFLIIFVLLSCAVLQMGINNYKHTINHESEFIELEKKKVSRYISNTQYGVHGFRVLFEYSPLFSLFYNSTSVSDLEAFIDSGVRLKITKPQKDGNIFSKPTGGNLDLSWYILIVMSIYALAFGWPSFRHSERLKYFLTLSNWKKVYCGVLLGRMLVLIFAIVFMIFVVGIQMLLNGLLTGEVINGLPSLLLVSIFLMFFLFILSSIIGTLKNKFAGVGILALIWLVLVLILPEVLNTGFSKQAAANMKSRYQLESQKIEILSEFEKLIHEKTKEVKTRSEGIELNKELKKHYWNSGFKNIVNLESNMIESIGKNARKFHLFSILTPTTFYKSVNNELSSSGYNQYKLFYLSCFEKFKGFARFFFDNRNNPKVEPYLNDDEHIFKAKSSLPAYFGLGVLLQIFYILVLFTIGFFRFKRIIFPTEKNEAFSDMDFKLEKRKHYIYEHFPKEKDFPAQVFNVLIGNVGKFTGKFSINDKNIVTGEKKNFVYLPIPDVIPGEMKVKIIINLLAGFYKIPKTEKEKIKGEFAEIRKKRFEEIKDIDKVDLMLRFAKTKKPDIYFLQNFLYGIKDTKILADIIAGMKKDGAVILEINSQYFIAHDKWDRTIIIRKSDSGKYEEMYTNQ